MICCTSVTKSFCNISEHISNLVLMQISYIYTFRHKIYIIYHQPPALPAADSLSTGTIVQPLQKARCTSQRNIIRVAWKLIFYLILHHINLIVEIKMILLFVFVMYFLRQKHRNFAIKCFIHVVLCSYER